MTLTWGLIAIQGSLVAVFPTPLGFPFLARVSLPFHIYAKTNFSKKKV